MHIYTHIHMSLLCMRKRDTHRHIEWFQKKADAHKHIIIYMHIGVLYIPKCGSSINTYMMICFKKTADAPKITCERWSSGIPPRPPPSSIFLSPSCGAHTRDCKRAQIRTHIGTCTHIYICRWMYTCRCTRVCIFIHIHSCFYVCEDVCVHKHMCAHIYTYMCSQACVYIHTHIHTHICLCIYIHVYVHMYIHVHLILQHVHECACLGICTTIYANFCVCMFIYIYTHTVCIYTYVHIFL